MGEEVKLLGMWASPYSQRVELALKLKGIPYEYIEQDLNNKTPLLLNSNPIYQKIPVLIHNGRSISESFVILEYIDETWPNHPILPRNPLDKATARFWAQFVDSTILSTASKYRRAKIEEKEEIIEQVGDLMRILEKELKGKKYYGGENIGYVDIVAFFILNMFLSHEKVIKVGLINQEKFPILLDWMSNLEQIEVVKQCIPPRDQYLDYIRALIASQ